MVETAEHHGRPDLLAERDERKSDHRNGLVHGVLLVLDVRAADLEEGLHLLDVPRACVRARLDRNFRVLADRVRHGLKRSDTDLAGRGDSAKIESIPGGC